METAQTLRLCSQAPSWRMPENYSKWYFVELCKARDVFKISVVEILVTDTMFFECCCVI